MPDVLYPAISRFSLQYGTYGHMVGGVESAVQPYDS